MARNAFEQFVQLRMSGGHDNRRNAVDRVDARGEDFKARPGHSRHVEAHARASRFPDPVPLHREHALGPARRELRHVLQQLVGVLRDAQEPLLEFLRSTGVVSCRQQKPSITCSLASTVWHSGHQFTRLFLR